MAARPYGMEIEVVESDVAEEIKSYARRLSQGDQSLLDEAGESPESRTVNGELLRAELRRAAAEGEIDRGPQFAVGDRRRLRPGIGRSLGRTARRVPRMPHPRR